MYTLSSRALSALAFDRGEEYDPAQPLDLSLLDDLDLADQAGPLITDVAPMEHRRRQQRARRQARIRIPQWFSPEDLLCRPWELAHHEPV